MYFIPVLIAMGTKYILLKKSARTQSGCSIIGVYILKDGISMVDVDQLVDESTLIYV